jgi:Peptidase A4 family
MKLSIALLTTVFFATTIVATPSRNPARRNRESNERRQGTATVAVAAAPTTTSYNWGAAILSAPPPNTSYTAVGGSFVVPKPVPPTGGPGTWGGGAWVGIDGYLNQLAILQAGVNWEVQVSAAGVHTYTYYAWYEWFPNSWVNYTMDVTAGDKMTVWCQSNSATDGYCTMTNGRTGITLTTVASAKAPFLTLTGQNVEWVVEDFADNFDTFGVSVLR